MSNDLTDEKRHLSCEEKHLTSCDWCGEDLCLNCGERSDIECPIHGGGLRHE